MVKSLTKIPYKHRIHVCMYVPYTHTECIVYVRIYGVYMYVYTVYTYVCMYRTNTVYMYAWF
jgi:hypothetical protein